MNVENINFQTIFVRNVQCERMIIEIRSPLHSYCPEMQNDPIEII